MQFPSSLLVLVVAAVDSVCDTLTAGVRETETRRTTKSRVERKERRRVQGTLFSSVEILKKKTCMT